VLGHAVDRAALAKYIAPQPHAIAAARTVGQAAAIAAATSGAVTKIPIIGKGSEIVSQPDADAAAASPIQSPQVVASASFALRPISRALMTTTISAVVTIVPRKSIMMGLRSAVVHQY